jgi:hypothetical protein
MGVLARQVVDLTDALSRRAKAPQQVCNLSDQPYNVVANLHIL